MPTQPLLHYKSLDDIRARKQALKEDLDRDSLSMKTQWNSLFHKPKSQAPSKRLSAFMTTGASVFDGILLILKLYNRYGGGRKSSHSRKKGFIARLLSW